MRVSTLVFFCFLVVSSYPSEPTDLKVGHSFTLQSKVMGEERAVLVHLPAGYESGTKRYPVLYLTDGDGHIKHTSGTVAFLAATQRMPEMIVVGVPNTNRARDLTPATVEAGAQGGGANVFLNFFSEELIPYIEKNYRTQPYRVFAGHSFGGLFAVNAFLEKPDTFNAYIAVSPSLWWSNESMIAKAKEFFSSHKKLNTTLYLTLGDEGPRMEEPLGKFLSVLKEQQTEGFIWDSKIFDDEDHGSVVLRSHYFGLKKVFEGWQPPRGAEFDAILAHYEKVSKRIGYLVQTPEGTVNQMGYGKMGEGNLEAALHIFKWNVENYPASANVYDSYAECLEKAGKIKEALTSYTKAYALGQANKDPNTGLYKSSMERTAELVKKSGT